MHFECGSATLKNTGSILEGISSMNHLSVPISGCTPSLVLHEALLRSKCLTSLSLTNAVRSMYTEWDVCLILGVLPSLASPLAFLDLSHMGYLSESAVGVLCDYLVSAPARATFRRLDLSHTILAPTSWALLGKALSVTSADMPSLSEQARTKADDGTESQDIGGSMCASMPLTILLVRCSRGNVRYPTSTRSAPTNATHKLAQKEKSPSPKNSIGDVVCADWKSNETVCQEAFDSTSCILAFFHSLSPTQSRVEQIDLSDNDIPAEMVQELIDTFLEPNTALTTVRLERGNGMWSRSKEQLANIVQRNRTSQKLNPHRWGVPGCNRDGRARRHVTCQEAELDTNSTDLAQDLDSVEASAPNLKTLVDSFQAENLHTNDHDLHPRWLKSLLHCYTTDSESA